MPIRFVILLAFSASSNPLFFTMKFFLECTKHASRVSEGADGDGIEMYGNKCDAFLIVEYFIDLKALHYFISTIRILNLI